jgi:hypothetical protein
MNLPKPESPPQFCGHCHAVSGIHWHCAHPGCLWGSCHACGKITELSGLIGKPPEQA